MIQQKKINLLPKFCNLQSNFILCYSLCAYRIFEYRFEQLLNNKYLIFLWIYSRCSWNQLDIMLESLVEYWNSESLLYYKHYWSFVTFSSFADWLCPNFPCFISSFEIWISQRGCWKFGKSFDELRSSTFRSVGLWSSQINFRFFILFQHWI